MKHQTPLPYTEYIQQYGMLDFGTTDHVMSVHANVKNKKTVARNCHNVWLLEHRNTNDHGANTSTPTDKCKKKIVSHFGLVEGRTGGHVCISKDTIDYPTFATLFALWTYQIHSGHGLRCYFIYYCVNLLDPRSFIHKIKRCRGCGNADRHWS